eukprot:TRINITY_DN32923_c0_g1_i2.p1 TRINITY_DN32923_c0_g1~~TRINITY_DN32923_c0_g1_i2.p1  ORF type:complete len:1133 (-),score=356.04 TRINITY_DN32923_c0_g1_i2:37-3378(-)
MASEEEETSVSEALDAFLRSQQDADKAAAADVAAAEPESAEELPWPLSEVERLKSQIGTGLRICILGGTAFQGADTEELVKATAAELSKSLGSEAVFVTGGMAGVQQAFAENCGDGSKVWNLLPRGSRSNYTQGTDVHAGANLDERKQVFGALGDAYVTFEGGPGVSSEAKAAVARGATVIPFVRTGGASSGMFEFPPPALARPWFATQEQWSQLTDKQAPVPQAAAACSSILGSFAAHHMATQVDECDDLCYADPDAERWAALAEMGHGTVAVPDVQKGNMRLQGTFSGTATTHTHQMDVAVGLDVEMPSQVAASAIKQLTDAGMDFPSETQEALQQVAQGEKKSLFGTLVDYFRSDAKEAEQPDIPSLIMSGMQLKLEDVEAAYEQQKQQLVSELDAARHQAEGLEGHLASIQEERDELVRKLEAPDAKVLSQRIEQLEGQLAQKEAEMAAKVDDLQSQLRQSQAEAEAKSSSLSKELAARERLQSMMDEAHGTMEALSKQNADLQAELGDVKASSAGLAAQLQSLQEAKEHLPAVNGAEEDGKLAALREECAALQAKLSAAEAASPDGRSQELEAQLSELAGREAEARALFEEVSKTLKESNDEVERLRAEGQGLREELAKVTASQKRLSATAAELNSKLMASPSASVSSRSSGPKGAEKSVKASEHEKVKKELAELLTRHSGLQAEHERTLRSVDSHEGERANRKDELGRLQKQSSELRKELDKAKADLAAEAAAKAAAVAQVSQEKEATARLKKVFMEQKETIGKVGSSSSDLVAKVKDLEQQLKQANESHGKVTELSLEVKKLRAQIAGEEGRAGEMKSQHEQALKETSEAKQKAHQWQNQCHKAQGDAADLAIELEASKKALVDANRRLEQVTEERNKTQQQLREARRSVDTVTEERARHEDEAQEKIRNLEEDEVARIRKELSAAQDNSPSRKSQGSGNSPVGIRGTSPPDGPVTVLTAPLVNLPVGSGTMPLGPGTLQATPLPSSGAMTPSYRSVACPSYGGPGAQGVKRRGKVTHIGTTTTIKGANGVQAVYTPVAQPLGSSMALPVGSVVLPPAPVVQAQQLMVQSPSAGAIHGAAAVNMQTQAGPVQGRVGLQITGVRRIR